MKKTKCSKCNRLVSNNNFKKHYNSCDGTYFTSRNRPSKKSADELYQERLKNIQRARTFAQNKPAWSKGLTKDDPRIKKQAESLKKSHKDGKVDKAHLTDPEYRRKMSESAKKQGFGGYRENAGKSKKSYYTDTFGNTVCLQSTYEQECAKVLDKLGIRWIRPKSLIYNETKRYFPDFYLVDYDIYLDPKNNYLAKKDRKKISCVCKENNVIVYVLTEEKLKEAYIKSII